MPSLMVLKAFFSSAASSLEMHQEKNATHHQYNYGAASAIASFIIWN